MRDASQGEARGTIVNDPGYVSVDGAPALVFGAELKVSGSPRILGIAWGAMEIADVGRGKDMKLWPGGGRAWDWRETGTHHRPGIQVADVEELVEHGACVVVLSRGMQLRLQTTPETLEFLRQRDVECHVEETKAAVELYNRLAKEGKAVGGLFHSTC